MNHLEDFFVSVIIPVYNGEAFLAEAIQSIQRQNYHPLEIIVVDDGSTDKTAEVAARFQDSIRYVYQPNQGAPVARNRGINMAQGNIIAFLDADDFWTDNKLEIQLGYLASNPSIEVVLGYTQRIRLSKDENGKLKWYNILESWPALSLGGAIMVRSAFDKVGLLDEKLFFDDDVDWFLRVKEMGVSILIHEEIVQFYRRHDSNITNKKEVDQSFFIKAIKKSLDRRRGVNNKNGSSLPKWFPTDKS